MYLLAGLAIGTALSLGAWFMMRKRERAMQDQLVAQEEERRARDQADSLELIRTSFAALSREALSANSDEFLKLARTRLEQQAREAGAELDGKEKLIDASVEGVNKKLTSLNDLLHQFDKQQRESHGALKGHMERATVATNQLQNTTAQLREALANPKRRGQWGERMAEDVLKLAGFVENVNYRKQTQLANRRIPDFTFPLPSDRIIHMDVKFPLDNYLKLAAAEDDAQRDQYAQQFIKDVRGKIKQVTDREYINPAEGKVDYVLVFIPNEQVYGYIHEHDSTILDDALRMKVVLCSP
jgi:DNA recombination protein RmuC